MSTSSASFGAGAVNRRPSSDAVSRLRAYFFSDTRRTVTTVLGLIWLLDGALQFQSFMYGDGFIQLLKSTGPGQPQWLASSINWGANAMHDQQGVFNTLSALVQVGIGIGLLYRPAVKPALLLSFGWAFAVWWFGEAFGMLFMNMANMLTGAPGAVIIYALIGAIVWPNGKPGGLLGLRATRLSWGVLWVWLGLMWLVPVNIGADATSGALRDASGSSGMGWLSSLQVDLANAARGDGLVIGLVLGALTVAIGIAVAVNWNAKRFLIAAIVLNLAYWVFAQGFGDIFAGGATDVNAGPVFILLALALYDLVPYEQPIGPVVRTDRRTTESTLAGAQT